MSRRAAPKHKVTKTTRPVKQARKKKRAATAKSQAAASSAGRKRPTRKRSGAASSAALGMVSGSDFLPRAPLAPSRSRKERKGVTVYLEPAQKQVLDRIAAHRNVTLQELGLEAFALLFEQHTEARHAQSATCARRS